MVGDLVNLNKYRKQHRRADAARLASENRVRFGRSTAERARTRSEHDRQTETLDGKRFDDTRDDESE
ncbi:MAG: DUF4169 family protein [Dongiaceae bacterium]